MRPPGHSWCLPASPPRRHPALLSPCLPTEPQAPCCPLALRDGSAVASPATALDATSTDAVRQLVLCASSRLPEQGRRLDRPRPAALTPPLSDPFLVPSATTPRHPPDRGHKQDSGRSAQGDGTGQQMHSVGIERGKKPLPKRPLRPGLEGLPAARLQSTSPASPRRPRHRLTQNQPSGRSSWFRPINAARRWVWTKPVCRAECGL